MSQENLPACCRKDGKEGKNEGKGKGLAQGIMFGLIPHAGCIAFIVFSLLGVTAFASVFKPLLAKSYFFYIMILVSFVFASGSAYFYLRRFGGVSQAKSHKGYLGILYGSTIFVSALLYFFIFPLVGGLTASSGIALIGSQNFTIKVDIPCSGHAPLITDELKKGGASAISFASPNIFTVSYDSSKISKEELLNLEIFKEYKATEVK